MSKLWKWLKFLFELLGWLIGMKEKGNIFKN